MSVDLISRGRSFAKVLKDARARAHADFEWYRYDSLSNLAPISDLLSESHLQLAREKGLLDAGCGDGDLSFFFESMGCGVVAMDHPGPNHNGMRGVRRLKEVLDSRVEIRAVRSAGAEVRADAFSGRAVPFEKSVLRVGDAGEVFGILPTEHADCPAVSGGGSRAGECGAGLSAGCGRAEFG
jgi:hypothetical protein